MHSTASLGHCMQMTSGSSADYMDTVQKNIKPRMRTLVIDWLIDVADDFRMVTESLYLTVAHFDRCGKTFQALVPWSLVVLKGTSRLQVQQRDQNHQSLTCEANGGWK